MGDLLGITYLDVYHFLTLAVLAAPIAILARWQATDFDRAVASDLREELDARMERKQSADVLGLAQCDLSEQLNAQQPLNFYRVLNLATDPSGLQALHGFLKRFARRLGGEYLDASTVTLLTGAAKLSQNRPVIAMLLPESDQQEVA